MVRHPFQDRRWNMTKSVIEKLISMARFPDGNPDQWLGSAREGLDFLMNDDASNDNVLFADGTHLTIHSILALTDALHRPDHLKISNSRPFLDSSCQIQKPSGLFGDNTFSLGVSLDELGCEFFRGGEKLIFIRDFEGVEDYEPPIEISQSLVHALDVHYIHKWNAYCRLNCQGAIEGVIQTRHERSAGDDRGVRIATIQRAALNEYMNVTKSSLITFVWFARHLPGDSGFLSDNVGRVTKTKDTYYDEISLGKRGSFLNGYFITHPKHVDDTDFSYISENRIQKQQRA